jgi:hypothetical protein
MPEPSARVVLSETSIAHEVFGTLWGLIFLGAVRESIPVPIPFGPALDQFVNDHGDAIDRSMALIQQALGLSSGAMALFDDFRRNLPGGFQTRDVVAEWLAIYSLNRAPLDLDLGDEARVRRTAQFGVKCQLYGLVEAMILALADRLSDGLNQVSAAHRVVTEGTALASEPDPATTAGKVYEAWCLAGLVRYLDPRSAATEEARSQLREVVDQLDAAFGIGGEA